MIKNFLLKWAKNSSRNCINTYIKKFSDTNTDHRALIVASAAAMNAYLSKSDPDFARLIRSKKGENLGEISIYTIRLNALFRSFSSQGMHMEAAGVEVWYQTFKCMDDEEFILLGRELWRLLSASKAEAKENVRGLISLSNMQEDDHGVNKWNNALNYIDFTPPLFL